MKIGILTFHRAINYGAYLQACSLCTRLNKEGFQTEIIDFRTRKEEEWYSRYEKWNLLRKLLHRKEYLFKKKLTQAIENGQNDSLIIKSKETLCSDSIEEFRDFVNGKYDVIISGSDEVWKLDSLRGFPSPYWLPGDLGCRKFSYAVSSRVSTNVLSESEVPCISKLLNEFEYVSLRDKKSFNIFRNHISNQDLHINCDPSFLSDFQIDKVNLYDYLQYKCNLDKKKPNIVIMLYDPRGKVFKYIKKQLGDDYNLIGVAEQHSGLTNLADLTPREWLTVIANADLVISSFFHGVCFSIVEGTPFLALETVEADSKVSYLLKNTSLENRFIDYGEHKNHDFKQMVKNCMIREDFSEFIDIETENFNNFLRSLNNENKIK